MEINRSVISRYWPPQIPRMGTGQPWATSISPSDGNENWGANMDKQPHHTASHNVENISYNNEEKSLLSSLFMLLVVDNNDPPNKIFHLVVGHIICNNYLQRLLLLDKMN